VSYPSTHRSVTVVEAGKVETQDKAVPAFSDEQILVRVRSVALNPLDWRLIDFSHPPGFSTGCDFSGDIVALGDKAKASGFKIGDIVSGMVSSTKDNGAFQEYVVIHHEITIHSAGLPYGDAAATPVAISTAMLALNWALKTPVDGVPRPEPLLVWGGSSGVGMYAIKLATHAGYRVVTTCSVKNFELVKSLGAAAVFDYKDPTTPEKIDTWVKEQGIGPLRKGLDCVSERSSLLGATSCFADGTGELATLLPPNGIESTVNLTQVLAFDIWNPTSSSHKLTTEFYKRVPKLIEKRILREGLIPTLVWEQSGLKGVPPAIDYVRQGKHSGQKVVVNIA